MAVSPFPQMPPANPGDMIAEYIRLRDAKTQSEANFKEFVDANYNNRMEEIEQALLNFMHSNGGNSFAAKGVGTAYRTTKTSVTVADKREFVRHIIGNEDWDAVDWRPLKTTMLDRMERKEELPPGLNVSTIYAVNIRKG